MAFKTERIIYAAKNFETGLTDITANIRRNGSSVATGVALSAVGNGFYELVLTPVLIAGYGGEGLYDFYINSASKNAPASTKQWILEFNESDIYAKALTIEGKVDGVVSDINALEPKVDDIQTKVTDNKTTLESATFGLAALKTLIDTLQGAVSSVQNNTSFSAAVPVASLIPSTGSTSYRIPINVYDTSGNLEDPDSNAIAVSITNQAGADRTSRLAGYVSGPVNATRISQGQYVIDFTVASTEVMEQWNFKFDYSEGAKQVVQNRTTNLQTEVQSAGVALETTAQAILTDTADMQPRVLDIQTKIDSATFGLAALKTLLDTIAGYTDSLEGELANGTYGLSAIATAVAGKASQASVTDIQGSGFVSANDSLKAISDRIYTGGVAY